MHTTVVPVDLGARSYDILIGADLISAAGNEVAKRFPECRAGIVCDENLAAQHLPRLMASLKEAGLEATSVVVPAGETSKSFSQLENVVRGLLQSRLERGDLVIALGGGVIGDLAGFAAAIVRRGMKVVQIPTSLLAQVDSSVGGKTGINTAEGKNLVGAFHQPALVLADTSALKTLPEREFRAGYAEVVKYGLIDDALFFEWLEAHWREIFDHGPALTEAIARSCEAKARVVAADELEGGKRALLNLGHTFGHALEQGVNYDAARLVHGEAVAIGINMALRFSQRLELIDGQSVERAARHFEAVGLPTTLSQIPGALLSQDAMMAAIAQDKKVSRGALTFILARGLGKSYVETGVDPDLVAAHLDAEQQL